MKDIKIKPILNGWLVKVGCAEIAFTDVDKMCKELKRYCNEPDNVEKEYEKKALNKTTQGESIVFTATNDSPTVSIGVGS
ncbi:hypothetical protein LCGC14_3040410 [marine sediment metagenome]|uniref:Uncharacterized protein n=1 Tax=marine sediment metagenome TaxID=412755 RepID=A0A0F8WPK8_9ZZZZ